MCTTHALKIACAALHLTEGEQLDKNFKKGRQRLKKSILGRMEECL